MFRNKLVMLRDLYKMTQACLAEKIGVTTSAVAMWENGSNLPNVAKLCMIADTFDVSVDFLLDRENDNAQTQYSYSSFDKRFIEDFTKLSDFDKGRVVGYIKTILDEES